VSNYGIQSEMEDLWLSELAGFADSDDDMPGSLPKTARARNGREQQVYVSWQLPK
jgi:hypothetical protein